MGAVTANSIDKIGDGEMVSRWHLCVFHLLICKTTFSVDKGC